MRWMRCHCCSTTRSRAASQRPRWPRPWPSEAGPGENRKALLDEILTIVLDPDVGDEQVRPRLQAEIGMDRMRAAHPARMERLPRGHGHLAMLDAPMSYLRQFSPKQRRRLA